MFPNRGADAACKVLRTLSRKKDNAGSFCPQKDTRPPFPIPAFSSRTGEEREQAATCLGPARGTLSQVVDGCTVRASDTVKRPVWGNVSL